MLNEIYLHKYHQKVKSVYQYFVERRKQRSCNLYCWLYKKKHACCNEYVTGMIESNPDHVGCQSPA